jgi:hypothetical protein
MAGRSRASTGQNATMLLLQGGVAVDRWERLRGGAFGFGLYKVRNAYASSSTRSGRPRGPAAHGPTSTSNRCGSQACTATSAVAIPTLRWLRSRCCGWPTGHVSVDSSSKRMPSQRRLRMPPRRHKTGWPYVDPNPLGTLRQSRTAWGLQLTPGPVMAGGRYGGRPGSDPAGNPPLSRCIRSPIRCSVWMSRRQAASSGEHPERRERLRNTKSLATRPGQQARARYDTKLWMRDLKEARRTFPSDQRKEAGGPTPAGRNANADGSR